MRKRISAILLSVVMLISIVPIASVLAKSADAVLNVTSDKTKVNPGNEITFYVSIDTSVPFTGIQFDIDVPTGLKYVANSGKIADGLNAKLNFAEASFTELTKRATFGNDTPYTASGELTLAEFKCTVDSASVGDYSIGIKEIDVTDSNFDSISNTMKAADIKVVISTSGVTLNKDKLTLKTGENEALIATVNPEKASDKSVTWESDNHTVATVDANGKVTGIKKGIATITVKTVDGNFTDTCIINVECSHINTTNHPADPSTCVHHGHDAYTVCDECGEIISGSDEKLPFANHTGGTADCLHKAVCSVCGEEYGELGAHNYVENTDGKYLKTVATCTHKAVYYKSCSVCGEKSTETFEYGEVNPSNHVGDTYIVGQTEATCYEEGYTGDIYCSDCRTMISKGNTIAKTAHNPASVWSTDADYHWKECQTIGCGNIIDKAAHSGGTATCIHKAVCSVCGVEYGTVDPNNHEHTEIRGGVSPTCTKEGYTGDTYCTDCGAKISSGKVIEKTPHTYVDSVIAPTCTEKGYTLHKCSDCGDEYKDTYTNATGHKVENWTVTKEATVDESGIKAGKCTICGETVTIETGKLIDKVSEKNTEGNITATLESIDGTKIYEDIVFSAYIITDSISNSDKEAMLSKIFGDDLSKTKQEVVGVLDLSMIMRDRDSNGNIISEQKYQPDGKVRVTVELPEEWFTKFENVVLNHLKENSSVEKVYYTRNNKTVTFEASGFSNYVFTGEAIAKDDGTTDNPQENTKPSSPQTGDTSNIYLWIALAFISASVLTGTVISKKGKTSK